MSAKLHIKNKKSAAVIYTIGICSAICVMVLGPIVCTYLTLKGSIRLGDAKIMLLMSIFVGSLVGGLICIKLSENSPLMSALTCVIGIMLSMAAVDMLVFTGIRSQYWGRSVVVLLGVAVSMVFCMVKRPKRKYRKMRSR